MPKYRITLSDGRRVTLEAPTQPSEAQILSALGQGQGGPSSTALPEAATAGMLPQSTPQGDPQGVNGWNAEHAEIGRLVDEAPIMAEPLMPNLVKGARAVIGAIPTRAKAGAKFKEVMGAVGQNTVDVGAPGNAALRISEMAERGGTMPKVVRDFVRRVTDPQKADLTYREARDFYSNISRLSADEYQRLTPALRMEVGKMRVALDRALAATAKAGGKEEVYRAAMKQYALAARTRELV